MRSFLVEVVEKVLEKHKSIEDLIFILPSKRAGTFLRNIMAKKTNRPIFAPKIYSIEEFVEKISGLSYASNTFLLFELYNTYSQHLQGDKESFHEFSKWGQTLLQDFNEVDRHLIDSAKIFGNLSAIQEMNHWSLQDEKTQIMENYLHFWNNLEKIYDEFGKNIIDKEVAHQGLVYRRAYEHLKDYQEQHPNTHIFLGFNALNEAESRIIQKMLSSKAEIYWDIDTSFVIDPIHDAGYFIRKYQKNWPYFTSNELQGPSNYYNDSKNIQIIGVPKSVSQAKYVGELLKNIHSERPDALLNTALVLGDENLLNPILNSIPKEIDAVNVTMGYPLRKTILYGMFRQFFNLHLDLGKNGWYHKDVIAFLTHPYIERLLKGASKEIIYGIRTKNLNYLTPERIVALVGDHKRQMLMLFDKTVSVENFLNKCSSLITELRKQFQDQDDTLGLKSLYHFHTLFNQIFDLLQEYEFIKDLKSLHSLFEELVISETLDFQGDPLEGLQIMGMLESRNLDFETIILTSVNEGILPSGKTDNSFIPFDLKAYYGLPTYKEKDAVYTYHFYRLLQRAKNVYILYNTEPDVLDGGEKSRLIYQLLTDDQKLGEVQEMIASPEIIPITKEKEIIAKDKHLLEFIKALASNGFSPSSLSNYIRNPIDFYKQSILGIENTFEVEETVASNTFGTVIHDTLEDLYTPLIGQFLTEANLTALKPNIEKLVQFHFSRNYHEGNIDKGKNLIAYHVIVKYLHEFIAMEIEESQQSKIKILGVEEKMKLRLDIPEIGFPIYLKGKLDRIDEKDGILRVIDYKTGKVEPKNVTLSDWEDVYTDYDYSKAFQLLCYALMYHKQHQVDDLEAGIISFKNLHRGLQKLTLKEPKERRNTVDSAILEKFQIVLKKLILEICDIGVPFVENEV